MHYALKRAFDRMLVPLARRRLARWHRNPSTDPEAVFDYVFSWPKFGPYQPVGIMQRREELVPFLKLLQRLEPRVALEIGTANGGSLFCLSQYVADRVVSVDLPRGPFGGGYEPTRDDFYRSFPPPSGCTITLIKGDSKRTETRVASEKAAGGSLDLLFIDGDHSYEGVSEDFRIYSALVKPGGIVAFHDIVTPALPGVGKFWREVSSGRRSEEFVSPTDPLGIGVLYV